MAYQEIGVLFERHSPDFALSLEQGEGRQGVLHHLLQGVAELDIMYLGENNSLCVFRISSQTRGRR